METQDLTVLEAAVALGVDPSVVRRRIRLGQMEARRAGARLYLIPAAEIARQRAIGRRKPGPRPKPG